MSIKNNTTNLQSLLEQVNNLPEAGGINTSDATATATDIFLNKTAYVNNEKITGNFTIDEELSSQNELIEQILDIATKKAANPTVTPTTCRIAIDNSYNGLASFQFSYIELDSDSHLSPVVVEYSPTTASREFQQIATNSCINVIASIFSSSGETYFTYDGEFKVIKNDGSHLKLYIPSYSTGGTIIPHSMDCCFVPGTQILTSLEGDAVSIENLSTGDTIVSYDINNNLIYLAKVKKLIINKNTTDIAEVYFENGEKLIMNAYHPIYTKDGFHSLTKYHGYDELQIGDIVKTLDNWTTITNIVRYTSEPIITYNLDVIDFDEEKDNEINDIFFANGIAVHNAACPTK